MKWVLAAATTALVGLLLVAMLAPFESLSEPRISLADKAVRAGYYYPARILLSPAASAGNATALNNLAAINYHSDGYRRDRKKAVIQLQQAALAGSERGTSNLMYSQLGKCLSPGGKALDEIRDIMKPLIDAGNEDAQLFLVHCERLSAQSDAADPTIDYCRTLADYARRSGEPPRFYSAVRICANTSFGARYYHHRLAREAAVETAALFFDAIEAGEPDTYLLFTGVTSHELRRWTEGTSLGRRIADKTNQEWLLEGSEKGCWRCQCHAALAEFTTLRSDSRYAAELSDRAISLAERCVNHKHDPQREVWHESSEYGVYAVPASGYDYTTKELTKRTYNQMRRFIEFEEANPDRKIASVREDTG